jgi:hypothetical protein
MEGLDKTFEAFYEKLFPLTLEAYKGCTDISLIMPNEDSVSGKEVMANKDGRDRELVRWDLDGEFAEGVYQLYYAVRSPEPIEKDTEWAIVMQTDDPSNPATYQEIARLLITRDYMNVGCRHLESLRLRIKPHSTLMIWVKDDLDKRILLDKLWISPLL